MLMAYNMLLYYNTIVYTSLSSLITKRSKERENNSKYLNGRLFSYRLKVVSVSITFEIFGNKISLEG